MTIPITNNLDALADNLIVKEGMSNTEEEDHSGENLEEPMWHNATVDIETANMEVLWARKHRCGRVPPFDDLSVLKRASAEARAQCEDKKDQESSKMSVLAVREEASTSDSPSTRVEEIAEASQAPTV